LYLKVKKIINRKKEFKKEIYASAAFSLTVSTRVFASCSALFLFASFVASTANEKKKENDYKKLSRSKKSFITCS
jgi:hypothetical protein